MHFEQKRSEAKGYRSPNRCLGFWASVALTLAMSGNLAASQPLTTFSPPGAATQTSGHMSTEEATRRKVWNEEMARSRLPKAGCFNASYPETEWKEVPCGAPSPYHNQPKPPNAVGNTTDFSAVSSGLITSAVGSFLRVSAPISVTGVPAGGATAALDVFMLQINTQFFANAPACNGVAGCKGWEQFLFSQTQCGPPGPGQQSVVPGTTACVFIEYWLLGFGAICPAAQPVPGLNWTSDGSNNCFFNGNSSYVPPQTAASLAELTFSASAGVQDQVTLTTSNGNISAVGQDSVLSLNRFWNTAEFNVFGDCCKTETFFSNPTSLILKTSIVDGTTNAPACGTSSFTAEQNNLTLAPTASPVCCPYGGTSQAVEFMESNEDGHRAICGRSSIEPDPREGDIITIVSDHY